MSEWVKRGQSTTLRAVIEEHSGVKLNDLQNPQMEDPRKIKGLYEAAEIVVDGIKQHTTFTIVGDYDSDGLNASAILVKLFQYYSVTPYVVIPRRMSDGYGLSANIVSKVRQGIVITIDNGITAIDQVQALKDKGCSVIIMDHHLPGETLPPADVIVDPHVDEKANGFLDYCGAGLGLQLARLMLEQDKSKAGEILLASLTVHAAIATITDVMPLVGPNRRIVMDGLAYINNPGIIGGNPGLAAIRLAAKTERVDEGTIGFQIGPLINAPARLYDNGGTSVLKALVCTNINDANTYASRMADINTERKELVKQYLAEAIAQIQCQKLLDQGNPLVLCMPSAPEGLLGILAGHLAQAYKRSAFVLTHAPDGTAKGSGRAYGKDDLGEMVEAIRPFTEACGGHTGAAGLTLKVENVDRVTQLLHEIGNSNPSWGEVEEYYDLEISAQDVPGIAAEQRQYAPFGEGNRKPVFLLRGITPHGGRFIGAKQDTVKFTCDGFDILGFGMAEEYRAMGCPQTFDALCTIGENTFNGRTTIQAELVDIR